MLLGWAWTYLIVAELIGVSSGITAFINQQAKYRNYDKVFAGIIIIGLIGLFTDMLLASWAGSCSRGEDGREAGVSRRLARERPAASPGESECRSLETRAPGEDAAPA